MRYLVHGDRSQAVTVEVEADSVAEALAAAESARHSDIEVWDTDHTWYSAEVMY